MRSDWKDCALGDAITLKRGYDLPAKDRRPGSVPIVSSSGFSDVHSEPMVQGPGVVTGRYGTIGQVFYVDRDFWPLNTTLYVQDFKGNDRRFIAYLLRTVDFHQFSDKAAVPGVNRNHLHTARILLPSLLEQVQVAALLQSFDDRIDLLRRTNATLESIAQALFKSWFIDFDPVRAKAEGREPEGMDAATAALFPAEFEASALGVIPKGWKVSKVSELASLKGGKQLERNSFDDAGPNPIFGGAGEMGRTHLSNAEGFVLTVGRVGAYCGQFFWHEGTAWVNNNASLVRVHSPNDCYWLHQALLASDIEKIKKGAAQPFVSNSDVEALPVIIPPAKAREAFHEIAKPLYERQSITAAQASSLQLIRDTLLPRLISGKLRLTEAREQVEEVLG